MDSGSVSQSMDESHPRVSPKVNSKLLVQNTEVSDSPMSGLDFSSDSTFYDEETSLLSQQIQSKQDPTTFSYYLFEGNVLIIGQKVVKTNIFRYLVIGPDFKFVIITYAVILIPTIFTYLILIENIIEEILFSFIFVLTILSLTITVLIDPGLVRKYHNARTRFWTFCDFCESFRPPGTVHCSTCQVCIGGYDHHCPWTGKCVGKGNRIFFKLFVLSLPVLMMTYVALGISYTVRNN